MMKSTLKEKICIIILILLIIYEFFLKVPSITWKDVKFSNSKRKLENAVIIDDVVNMIFLIKEDKNLQLANIKFIIFALSQMKDNTKYIPFFIEVVKNSQNINSRAAAIKALAEIGDSSLEDFILSLYNNASEIEKKEIIYFLSKQGTYKSVDILGRVLLDEKEKRVTKFFAINGLKRIKCEKSKKFLEEGLLYCKDKFIKEEIKQTLKKNYK